MGGRGIKKADTSGGGRERNKKGQYLPLVPMVEIAAPDESAEEKPLRPRQCRGYLRRELAGSFRSIVSGFVKQAKSGSVQHLKLATELLGETPERKQRKGSAVLLLEELGLEDVGGTGEKL